MSDNEEKKLGGERTLFVGRGKKTGGSDSSKGLMDQDEWNRALAEADEQAAKKAAEASAAGETADASESRTARRSMRSGRKSKASAASAETAAAAENGKKKKKKKKKGKAGKIILTILLVFLVLGLIAAGVCAYIVYGIIKETPEINPENIYELLSQNSAIYDKDGNLVEYVYNGGSLRTNLDYDEMPQQLIDAFVCLEDKTFWEHNGFNYVRIVGAIVSKVTGKSDKISGTSTITQQLARNIYLSDKKSERSLTRKIQEAYYTVVIEKSLSKEKIIEAYLNTIYLGFNSDGVYAAAKAYFNKDVQDLTLLECAQLAALPQSPNAYAPLKRMTRASYDALEDKSTIDVVTEDSSYVTYYNDTSSGRIKTVLRFMYEQGKIDEETYNATKDLSIRDSLNPGLNVGESASNTSYFADYVVKQVLSDLQTELGLSYSEAYDMLYTGGLVINSTMDMQVQSILEEEYSDRSNFPKISLNSLNLDKQKNILNEDGDKIILYAKKNLLDDDGNLVIAKDEFKWNDDGSLTLYKGKKLNFYNTKSNGETDVRIDLKDMYEMEDGYLFSRSDSYWKMDAKYKTRDTDGNVVISADYFTDYPDMFTKNADGSLTYSSSGFVLSGTIIQPQSAMTIIESSTGQIRAMIGGREISGKLLYNRATATRQPGSSIKPLTVYSNALQLGYNRAMGIEDTETTDEEGNAVESKIFTAATPLDNIPINIKNSLWPSNFDKSYSGITSLRKAVEKSLNGCAVNLYQQLDPEELVTQLRNMGITSIDTEGSDTDLNPSALALGGMMNGVSPLEMASAYTTFGNYGIYNEDSCYTTVTDRKGDIILTKEVESVKVFDEPVASLMLDILRTTVTDGIAGGAKLKSQPSAGKTGTTSDMFDLWFSGLTPKYAASVWLGCDSNISLGADSSKATKLWSAVMERVGELDEKGEFELRGDFVEVTVDRVTGMLPSQSETAEIDESDYLTEIFIAGTEPTYADETARGYIQVCAVTGYLATPDCPVTYKQYIVRPGGHSWEYLLSTYTLKDSDGEDIPKENYLTLIADCGYDLPEFYCPMHQSASVDEEGNPVESEYPVSPIVRATYDLTGVIQTGGHYEYNGEEYIWVADPVEDTEGVETTEDGTVNDGVTDTEENDDQALEPAA